MLFTKLFTVLASTAVLVKGQTSNGKVTRPNPSNGHWVDAWASMPQLTEPANLPPAPFVRTTTALFSRGMLIRVLEPNWRRLCQLNNQADFAHDDRGFANPYQVLERIWRVQSTHYSGHSRPTCEQHGGNSPNPDQDIAESHFLRERLDQHPQWRIGCLRPHQLPNQGSAGYHDHCVSCHRPDNELNHQSSR